MTDTTANDMFDMSVVTDAKVAAALPQLLTQWRNKKRWSEFSKEARATHVAVLESFIATGLPPTVDGLQPEIVADLQGRDLIVIRDGAIVVAYPFASTPTRHSVQLDGTSIAAVCAIDALGAAAMVGKATHVTSKCATCEQEITVDILEDGLTIKSHSHDDPRLWAGIVPVAGCAADTQCQSMLLFCYPDHLKKWRSSTAQSPDGFAFTLAQAVQAGAAIFKPFLNRQDKHEL